MLQITRQTEYAIRGLMELAAKNDESPVRLKALAESCEVSEAFLAKIFQLLSQNGIVKSHRGVKGGFSLGRDLQDITMLEVVDLCEGGIVLNHCLRKVDPCVRANKCKMSKVWAQAQNALDKALRSTTLADLV